MDIVESVHLLCCPLCRSELYLSEGNLYCVKCSASFPIEQGIASLMPQDLRTDYALTMQQRDLNRRAAEVGWKTAVKEHVESHHCEQGAEYAYEYASREARADFRFLMPVTQDSIVLDIGSGWGNITTAFARTCRCVIALDTNLENLDFVRIRAQQDGLGNVILVQGDACTLPIQTASCDAVTMVGVLEWVAWGRRDSLPHRLQELALRRVHDALKPGGCLYVAIENRFSFKYFLGQKEPHTGLRFVSILPYRIAQMYSLLARKQDYREITYSLHGLRQRLRSAGFSQIDFFFPIPGYQNFRYLVDFQQRGVSRYVIEQLRAYPKFSRLHYVAGRMMLALPIRLERFLWPSFSVLAVRP